MASDSSGKRPIAYSALIRGGVEGRLYVNDIPVLRNAGGGNVTQADLINHLLIPGDNEILAEIDRLPETAGTEYYDEAVRLHIYEGTDQRDAEGRQIQTTLSDASYPAIWLARPKEERKLPFVHRQTFVHGIDMAPPLFVTAPPAAASPGYEPAVRAALAQLQQLVIDGDVDAFFDEVSLRMQHYEASRWGTAADAKAELSDTIFSQQIDVRPLDVEQIELEPRREGRVVVTRRRDGRPVIEASAPNNEGAGTRKLGVNPIFVQHEGRWRVIL